MSGTCFGLFVSYRGELPKLGGSQDMAFSPGRSEFSVSGGAYLGARGQLLMGSRHQVEG